MALVESTLTPLENIYTPSIVTDCQHFTCGSQLLAPEYDSWIRLGTIASVGTACFVDPKVGTSIASRLFVDC